MAKTTLKPLDDRVVVKTLDSEDKTAGGILLPDNAREKPQRGKVVAAGPGKLNDGGHRIALKRHGWFELTLQPFDQRALRRIAGYGSRTMLSAFEELFSRGEIEARFLARAREMATQAFGFKQRLYDRGEQRSRRFRSARINPSRQSVESRLRQAGRAHWHSGLRLMARQLIQQARLSVARNDCRSAFAAF